VKAFSKKSEDLQQELNTAIKHCCSANAVSSADNSDNASFQNLSVDWNSPLVHDSGVLAPKTCSEEKPSHDA
jgi:hypothetical protein